MRLRRSCLFLVAATLFPVSLPAQVDTSAWPQVRMELLATSGNGGALRGLTAADLTVTENRTPVKVDELKPVTGPMSVCFAIDTSGSMYDRRQSLIDTANRLIADLPPEDEYCIVDFSNQAFVDLELTTDHKRAAKALSYLKASGGTALYDTLSATATSLRERARYPDRAIIVLSDGADNASKMSLKDLEREWQTIQGMPSVHVLWIPGPKKSHDVGEDREKKAALAVVKMGGGFVFYPRNSNELNNCSDDLIDALKNRYLLTYTTGDTSKDGRQRQVDVGLDKARQKAKDAVRTPEGYYAAR